MDVTVLSRPGGHAYAGLGVEAVQVIEVAYDDLTALTVALRHQDALIEAFNPAAVAHRHTIVQAALAAGVKQLVTNEFGHDSFHENAAELPISTSKIEAQRVLEELLRKTAVDGKAPPLAWTAIITGPWYDFAIRKGFFSLNPTAWTITRFGSGEQKTSITRGALVGKVILAVLREPERFQNRPVYVASHTVTTNELITLAKEIIPERSWNVVDIPDLEAFKEQGLHLWSEDRKKGVDQFGTQAFMMLSAALLFDEHNRYGADFEEKLEPGWDEGREEFKDHLRQLIEEADK